MKLKLKKHNWKQVSGDMDPGTYGAIIARCDGRAIEMIGIMPVREYIGDREAIGVGFPYWTKEGYYELSDLSTDRDDVIKAMKCYGITSEDLEEMDEYQRALSIAECLLGYGSSDEGESGWAKDVLPGRVLWCGCKYPRGASYFSSEERDFRELLRSK